MRINPETGAGVISYMWNLKKKPEAWKHVAEKGWAQAQALHGPWHSNWHWPGRVYY